MGGGGGKGKGAHMFVIIGVIAHSHLEGPGGPRHAPPENYFSCHSASEAF